ncbi:type 1 glutamine amidotransferase [Pedobacter sp. SAFR-022]|uniref:type 1 glutamine amidotransferase n=1 Tax=Pedobacter sp. SAFR-022 TaxID=3436861 RepID=UPI003F7E6019
MDSIKKIKVAVIDMNNGAANQGMRGIIEILGKYEQDHDVAFSLEIFDLRQKGELPGLDHHLYISTGGPGSPYDGEGEDWENRFFELLEKIHEHNLGGEQEKKYVFLICHSFQLACRKFGLGNVTERKSNAFGIFPINLTEEGEQEPFFKGLSNPFYSVDSRDWQVIEPDEAAFAAFGAKILALEKERPNVDLERCIMAIRFSDEIIGTQFHPEADPTGMRMHLLREDKKKSIIENHSEEKYYDMLDSLEHPERISLTQSVILPNFITKAISNTLQEV